MLVLVKYSLRLYIVCIIWIVFFVGLSWFFNPLFSIIAFLPFFYILQSYKNIFAKFFALLPLFIMWNLSVTFWLCEINFGKGVITIIVNSVLMIIPIGISFLLIFSFKIKKLKWGIFFIVWLLFEYIHFMWDISWPWMTIGNVFGSRPDLIQWYEYFGVLGGTAWILLFNYWVWTYVRSLKKIKAGRFYLLLLICPIFISWLSMIKEYDVSLESVVKIGIMNTNFSRAQPMSDMQRVENKLKEISKTDSSEITLLPELFLAEGIWYSTFKKSEIISKLIRLKKQLITANLLVGANLLKENDQLAGMILKGSFLSNTIRITLLLPYLIILIQSF